MRWCNCLKAQPGCPPRPAGCALPGGGWRCPFRRGFWAVCLTGMGRPIDGGPPLIPDKVLDVNGTPLNPVARRLPGGIHPDRHFRHRRAEYPGARAKAAHLFRQRACRMRSLAAQIARQAKVRGTDEGFAVVFAAIGIPFEQAQYFTDSFERTGALARTRQCF